MVEPPKRGRPKKGSKKPEKVYTQEKILKKDLKVLLKERPCKYFMPVPTGYSEGAVDFILCYRGRFLVVETKVWPNTMTLRQEDYMNDVIAHGGIAIVAYHTDIVMHVLSMIDLNNKYFVRRIIGAPVYEI